MEQKKYMCEKSGENNCDCGPCTKNKNMRKFLDFSGRYLSNAENARKQMEESNIM